MCARVHESAQEGWGDLSGPRPHLLTAGCFWTLMVISSALALMDSTCKTDMDAILVTTTSLRISAGTGPRMPPAFPAGADAQKTLALRILGRDCCLPLSPSFRKACFALLNLPYPREQTLLNATIPSPSQTHNTSTALFTSNTTCEWGSEIEASAIVELIDNHLCISFQHLTRDCVNEFRTSAGLSWQRAATVPAMTMAMRWGSERLKKTDAETRACRRAVILRLSPRSAAFLRAASRSAAACCFAAAPWTRHATGTVKTDTYATHRMAQKLHTGNGGKGDREGGCHGLSSRKARSAFTFSAEMRQPMTKGLLEGSLSPGGTRSSRR